MMNKSKIFLIIGLVMAIAAIVFLIYTLNHPEGSFSLPNIVIYIIYGIYLIVMIIMFILYFVKR